MNFLVPILGGGLGAINFKHLAPSQAIAAGAVGAAVTGVFSFGLLLCCCMEAKETIRSRQSHAIESTSLPIF